jgi:hypothetical protein
MGILNCTYWRKMRQLLNSHYRQTKDPLTVRKNMLCLQLNANVPNRAVS